MVGQPARLPSIHQPAVIAGQQAVAPSPYVIFWLDCHAALVMTTVGGPTEQANLDGKILYPQWVENVCPGRNDLLLFNDLGSGHGGDQRGDISVASGLGDGHEPL